MGSTIRADLAPVTDLADDLAGPLMKTMMTDATDLIAKDVLKVGQQATGGDLRLSRYRGGGRMAVKVQITDRGATIDLTPPGVWALATGGAKPHYIGRGGRTKGGKARRKHPGFKGRNGLDKVWATIPKTLTETIEDALDEAVS